MSKPAQFSKKEKPKTSAEGPRARRARNVSTSIAEPEHIKYLAETLKTFPLHDLRSRDDFQKEEVGATRNISGRTYKKVVIDKESGEIYLLKKNGREAMRDVDFKKTPSSQMDLEQNHSESFREICAMRLFEFIFAKKGATPSDAKVVLSDFDSGKLKNVNKGKMTKVYFASKKIEGLEFNETRLSDLNSRTLKQKENATPESESTRTNLINELCEQILFNAYYQILTLANSTIFMLMKKRKQWFSLILEMLAQMNFLAPTHIAF